jgi:hypothetical protein
VDTVVVTTGRTVRFPGAAVTTERWWRRLERRSRTAMVEEERDGSVLRCGSEGQVDGGDDVDPTAVAATAWR